MKYVESNSRVAHMPDSVSDTPEKEKIIEHSPDAVGSPSDDSDWDLVLRSQSGDTIAFGELIERHKQAVYSIISRMLNRRDEVDDIAQDVFVTAWKSLKGFKHKAKFSTWLYTITVNSTIRRIKMVKRKATLSLDDPDNGLSEMARSDDMQSPSAVLERSERDRAIWKAVESLPDKHRIVIVLHYFEHLTCDEIAVILGCSTGTVWSRMHYACKKLKNELGWLIREN